MFLTDLLACIQVSKCAQGATKHDSEIQVLPGPINCKGGLHCFDYHDETTFGLNLVYRKNDSWRCVFGMMWC
jgi:hypothetical protein